MIKIAFAGNPNVGKSALINAMAGSKLKVGNWPGVTVEKKEANFTYKGEEITMIDLPGVYSLSPFSLEEKITREFIIEENPDVVINVVESTNIERNLYLTLLLQELGKPMIMALNFYDEFEKLNYTLDVKRLSELVEMEVIKTSAIKKTGLTELLDKAVAIAKSGKTNKQYKISFDRFIDSQYELMKEEIRKEEKFANVLKKYSLDYVTVKTLEKDSDFLGKMKQDYSFDCENYLKSYADEIEKRYDEDIETVLAEKRYGKIKGIIADTLKTSLKSRLDFTEKVDKILLNRVLRTSYFLNDYSRTYDYCFQWKCSIY